MLTPEQHAAVFARSEATGESITALLARGLAAVLADEQVLAAYRDPEHAGRKVEVTLVLRPSQRAQLRDMSARTRVPMSTLVRAGVPAALETWVVA